MPCCSKNRGDRRKPGFGEGLWWSEEVLAVGHGGGGGGGGCGGGGGRHGSPEKPQDVPEPAVDESKPTTSTEETDSVPEPTAPVVVDIPDKQPPKPSAVGYNTFDNRDSDNDRLVLIPFERKKKCFCRCSLTFLVMVSGFLFGYDTGVVSGSMLLIQPYFHLSMLWAQVIVSATVGTAAITSSVAEFVADFVGRKVVIGTAAVLFTTGAIVMSEAETVMVIIVGRIIVGFSMGFSTVVVVLYVKESALASRLKWLLGWLQLMYTIGNMVANFLTMVLHYLGDNTVWQYLLGFGAIPSILQFIAIMLLPESPRWLMECDDEEGARESLILLRGTDQVEDELEAIRLDVEEERNELDKDDSDDTWDILGDIIDEVEDELLSDSDEDGTNPNSSKDKQNNDMKANLNKDSDPKQQDSNKGPTEKENEKEKGNTGDDLLDKTKSGGKGQVESKEKNSTDAVQNKQDGGSQDGGSSKQTPQNPTDSSDGGNKQSNSGSGNGSQSAISDSAPSEQISGMNRNEQGTGSNSEQSGKSGSNPHKGGVDSTKDKNASGNPHFGGENGDGSSNGKSGQSVRSSSSADNVSKQDPSATDNESSGNASNSGGNDNQGGNSSSGCKNNSGGNKNTTGGDNNSDGNSNLGDTNYPDGNSNPGGNNNSGGNNNADSSRQNSGKSTNSPNESGHGKSPSTDGKANQSGNGANSNSGNASGNKSGGNGTQDSENNTNKDGGNQSTSGSPDGNSCKGPTSKGNEGNDQNVNATGSSSGSGKLGGKDSKQNSEKKSKKSKQKKKQKKVVNRKDYEKLEGGVVPKGSMSSKPPIIRILLKPKVRQSAMNVSFLHLFQQLSGISCIILYGGSMILLSGLPTNLSLGLLNIPNTLYVVATFLSNKFEPMKDDRRQLLLSSFIGVFFGMALIATGYQLLELYPRPVSVFENNSLVGLPLEDLYFGHCNHTYFQTCGMCIYTEFCGFCYTNWWDGSCLPTDLNNSLKSYVGRCKQSHTSNSHYKFIHNDCPNDFGWFVVVGMVVFVLAYAPGLGQITQRENSQRCPVWARKTSNSIARSINWGANLLISMTFLLLMVAMTKYGTCWMFTGLCLVGVIYTAILLPDE